MGDMIDRDAALALTQRAVNGYGQKMRGSSDKKEKRDWQSMLFAAVDIQSAIAALEPVTPAPVQHLGVNKGGVMDDDVYEWMTQPAPEPAPSDAGAATYGLPAPQSGEVPASSAPTPAPAAQLDAGAIREAALREAAKEAEYFASKDLELRLTRPDGTPVQRLTTEQAMREIRHVAQHISQRILALTEKPHDRA